MGPFMNAGRSNTAAVVLEGVVWVVGGMGLDGRVLSSCEWLQPCEEDGGYGWRRGPSMRQPRIGHAACVVENTEIWVVGGRGQHFGAVAQTEYFAEGRWWKGPRLPSSALVNPQWVGVVVL